MTQGIQKAPRDPLSESELSEVICPSAKRGAEAISVADVTALEVFSAGPGFGGSHTANVAAGYQRRSSPISVSGGDGADDRRSH